jgi:Surp module
VGLKGNNIGSNTRRAAIHGYVAAIGRRRHVVVPPPGVRVIFDQTARAVASRPALEVRIREKHAADPKFALIRPGDPYHASFRAQVATVAYGVADDASVA